jgi:hypothetical protein
MVVLQNCRDKDFIFSRCSNIEYIENVNNPSFDKISQVKSNEWEAKSQLLQNLQNQSPCHMRKEKNS